ncbi:MAG: transcription antitermination factor NusB [Acidimicrobiales bacterium]
MAGDPAAPRRAARESALGLLYEAEVKGLDPRRLLAELPAPPDPFAQELVAGVADHAPELDRLLADQAEGWELSRMPALDRALLRIGAFELAHAPGVPSGVVLAEAVELATRFSTEGSARYVNGVLAALALRLRPGGARAVGTDPERAAVPAGEVDPGRGTVPAAGAGGEGGSGPGARC